MELSDADKRLFFRAVVVSSDFSEMPRKEMVKLLRTVNNSNAHLLAEIIEEEMNALPVDVRSIVDQMSFFAKSQLVAFMGVGINSTDMVARLIGVFPSVPN